jgi:hypothetical protein
MNKFAATAVLASSVSAVELGTQLGVSLEHFKKYESTFDMLPEEKKMEAMPQGKGRDHTDWSWHLEKLEEAKKVTDSKDDLLSAKVELDGAQAEYDELMTKIID